MVAGGPQHSIPSRSKVFPRGEIAGRARKNPKGGRNGGGGARLFRAGGPHFLGKTPGRWDGISRGAYFGLNRTHMPASRAARCPANFSPKPSTPRHEKKNRGQMGGPGPPSQLGRLAAQAGFQIGKTVPQIPLGWPPGTCGFVPATTWVHQHIGSGPIHVHKASPGLKQSRNRRPGVANRLQPVAAFRISAHRPGPPIDHRDHWRLAAESRCTFWGPKSIQRGPTGGHGGGGKL